MSEIYVADDWIYDTLRGDATLMGYANNRVFAHTVPQTTPITPPPFVWFQFLDGRDAIVIGGARIWTNMLYRVRGVAEVGGIAGLADNMASRIDALLHNKAGVGGAGLVLSCIREQPFVLPETRDGRTFMHVGGVYRVYAKQ